jgi:tRNA (guanine37-N1)-methyltransferase
VDDTPYGGGAGMVLRADVMDAAIQKGLESHPESKLIYFSPRGVPFNQPLAKQLSQEESLLMICGRFEAVDERVIDKYQPLEISLGDFVMTGGEYAAMAVLDAAIRLLPGVIGEAESLEQESFGMAEDYALLLEHPHYTRPPVWEERPVPEVLLSGNHGEINAWRKRLSEEFTKARRPDLWKRYNEGNES